MIELLRIMLILIADSTIINSTFLILLCHLAFSGVILCSEAVAQLSKLAFWHEPR